MNIEKDNNIPQYYVIDSITSNIDNYNPRQITCFNKPWAIAYKSIEEEYFDLYLFEATYYELFMINNYFKWEDFFGNLDDNYYNFSKEVMESKFGVSIERIPFDANNEEEFHYNMQKAISSGSRVIVPGDLKGLVYYPEYKIKSHIHFFMVKGYDAERKAYFIVDNVHVDNGANPKYKDFAIKYSDLFEIIQLCFENFFRNKSKAYFWSLTPQNNRSIYTMEKALIDHAELLKKINKNICTINFPELDLLNKEYENIRDLRRRYTKVLNYKYVYYSVLFKLLEKAGADSNVLKELVTEKDKLVECWENIRMKMLYFLGANSEKRYGLKNLIEENLENEYKFREILIRIIEGLNLQSLNEIRNVGLYIPKVINYNEAEIMKNKKIISFKHSKEKVYDTWLAQNNAAQILLNIDNSDIIDFQCRAYVENKVGYAFFSGIILRTENNKKYLFGNESMNIISIHCPEESDNHLLFSKVYCENTICLRVTINKDLVTFYYKDNINYTWSKLYETNIAGVDKVGIISKTWDSIDHKTDFDYVSLKVNNREIDL